MAAGAITARLDQAAFDKAVERLGNQKIAVAAKRALNRAIVSARVPVVKAVSADMKLRQKDVRDAIKIDEATTKRLSARMTSSGKPIPLIKFAAKGPTPSRGKGRGVTANVGRGRTRYKHAFIARVRSGHVGVFKRDEHRPMARRSPGAWSNNLPIVQLHGPSIAVVFSKHRDIGIEAGRESLIKNLAHELSWAIEQSSVS